MLQQSGLSALRNLLVDLNVVYRKQVLEPAPRRSSQGVSLLHLRGGQPDCGEKTRCRSLPAKMASSAYSRQSRRHRRL